MTRKDYVAIANAIVSAYRDAESAKPKDTEEALVTLATNFVYEVSAVFADDNANYDMAKFHEAVFGVIFPKGK